MNYFLFGAFPLRPEVKLSEACGKETFRQAYVSNNLWQGLVSILTIGIYTPRTLQVWCGDAKKVFKSLLLIVCFFHLGWLVLKLLKIVNLMKNLI